MAVKSSLGFPLALFLLVSQMAIALGAAVDNTACEPVSAPPHYVSTPPPMNAPVSAPPHYVSPPPQMSPPVSTPPATPPPPPSPPVSAPPANAPSPVSTPPATPSPPVSPQPPSSVPPPVVGLHGCGGMCSRHCRLARPFRLCMRACGECCNKSLCVPSLMKCDNWPVSVVIHGKTVNCP